MNQSVKCSLHGHLLYCRSKYGFQGEFSVLIHVLNILPYLLGCHYLICNNSTISTLPSPFPHGVGVALVVLSYGGLLLANNQITPGSLMSFLIATQTIQRSLKNKLLFHNINLLIISLKYSLKCVCQYYSGH